VCVVSDYVDEVCQDMFLYVLQHIERLVCV